MASRLTRTDAIKISKELWTWLAETGSNDKEDWLGWDKYGRMWAACALCEYANQRLGFKEGEACQYCPYYMKFGFCQADDVEALSPYDRWEGEETHKDRKKYAKLFLEQLETL